MATVRLHLPAHRTDVPLVLLPPFPLDARAWASVAASVPGAITVDPPGFGGEPDAEPSLEGYARALLTALDAAGVGRFVVAGNSMGGYAAMCVAEMAPERLAGIGLFGTKSTADAPEAAANRLAMAHAAEAGEPLGDLLAPLRERLLGETTRATQPAVVAQVAALMAEATPAGVAWAQRAMASRPDRTPTLAALRGVPAVVFAGAQDPLMPPETQALMAEALGVRPIELPAVGHLLPLEAPGVCVDTLLRLSGSPALG